MVLEMFIIPMVKVEIHSTIKFNLDNGNYLLRIFLLFKVNSAWTTVFQLQYASTNHYKTFYWYELFRGEIQWFRDSKGHRPLSGRDYVDSMRDRP